MQTQSAALSEQLSSLATHTTKVEKFVSNLAALQQKMTERMQILQTENTKMLMKYNSFREDYMRLINEQVDMRTSSHKDEFISLDELRAVKIAIKEIDIKLKQKVDGVAYAEDLARRDRDVKDGEKALRDDLEKLRNVGETNLSLLRKADADTLHMLEDVKKEFGKLVAEVEGRSVNRDKEIKEVIKQLDSDLQASKTKTDESEARIQGKIEAIDQQMKNKKQDESKKLTDLQKKLMDSDKRLRNELNQRIQSLSIAVESLAARESTNCDRQLKQLSSLKVKLSTTNQTIVKLQQKLVQRHETIQGSVEGLRQLYNTEHSELITEMSNLRDGFQLLKADQSELSQKFSKIAQNSKGLVAKKRKISESMDVIDEDEKMSGRVSSHRRSGSRGPDSNGRYSIDRSEDKNGNVQGLGTISRESEQANIQVIQSAHSGMKTKLNDLEVSLNILREMIDSKVNQSQVLKLQENKCNKYAFKDLVMKLQVLKSVLERTLPNCEGLKQINFDDTGIYYATLSRLSTIRSRQNKGEQSSKSKQKQKNPVMQSDKRPSSNSKLPNMLSRSRKRYLTFFDRSDCNTPQQLRAANYT